jgi:hypothetical protein
MARIFLLSPADCGGLRARMVMREAATFELAQRLRSPEGAPLGDVFSFLSGLYFRGKLAYARAFATPPAGAATVCAGGVLVITPGAGLVPPDRPVTVRELRRFARIDVDPDEPRYRRPLAAAARALAAVVDDECDVVLLGSIASDKYVRILSAALGARLKFPAAFVGRGDMSRGGLLLRSVLAGRELEYRTLDAGPRSGPRPPRLAPLPRRRELVVP